jgi:hypothetical protein
MFSKDREIPEAFFSPYWILVQGNPFRTIELGLIYAPRPHIICYPVLFDSIYKNSISEGGGASATNMRWGGAAA